MVVKNMAPSSSGLGLLAFIQAIEGSNPSGVTLNFFEKVETQDKENGGETLPKDLVSKPNRIVFVNFEAGESFGWIAFERRKLFVKPINGFPHTSDQKKC